MLCADEIVYTAIDPRTGRVKLWDTGDLGAAGRAPRFTVLTERVNENPGALLLRALVQLRLNVRICLCVPEECIDQASTDNYRFGAAKGTLSRATDL
jgi:hypothetical protein